MRVRDKFWFVYLLAGITAVVPVVFIIRNSSVPDSSETRTFITLENAMTLVLGVIIIVSCFTTAPSLQYNVSQSDNLRVITLNIQQGYNKNGNKDIEGQLRYIRSLDPHIIGLQESDLARVSGGNTDIVRYLADNLKMHSYYGPKPANGTFGIALLSKIPIKKAETFYMYSVGEQTAAIEAQIEFNERIMNIFVTHLGNDGDMVQLQAVMKRIGDKKNVILMGDFNFIPSKEQYIVATEIFNDAWLQKWPAGVDDKGFNPDTMTIHEGRIDYTFLSKNIKVLDCMMSIFNSLLDIYYQHLFCFYRY
jgi:endonuclease/exonuclease/phosphatase family metal-dependent hydrolase